jgi:hypothetical protein
MPAPAKRSTRYARVSGVNPDMSYFLSYEFYQAKHKIDSDWLGSDQHKRGVLDKKWGKSFHLLLGKSGLFFRLYCLKEHGTPSEKSTTDKNTYRKLKSRNYIRYGTHLL